MKDLLLQLGQDVHESIELLLLLKLNIKLLSNQLLDILALLLKDLVRGSEVFNLSVILIYLLTLLKHLLSLFRGLQKQLGLLLFTISMLDLFSLFLRIMVISSQALQFVDALSDLSFSLCKFLIALSLNLTLYIV